MVTPLDRITRTVAPFATGSATVGLGPQRFGSPRLHQTALADNHAADETQTETSAGRLRRGMRATAIAMPKSMGAQTGNVYAHCPKLVATPLPPRNRLHTG